MSGKVALVTGCNGISGHAIAEHLTKQPDSEWFIPSHSSGQDLADLA